MLRLVAVAILVIQLPVYVYAGEPLFVPHGADQASMAFASVAFPCHWSSFQNQALMTCCKNFSAGISVESRFMMEEMSSKALSLVVPGNKAPLGIVVTHYGYSQYAYLMTGVGSAVTISDKVSLGMQIDYLWQTGAGDYPDVHHLTFETGLYVKMSNEIALGMHIFNPVSMFNSLPSSIRSGLSWSPSADLVVAAEVSQATGEPLSAHCGVNWFLKDCLSLRAGYFSSPATFTFGAGYLSGRLRSDIGFMFNNLTGISSSLSFTWIIKNV